MNNNPILLFSLLLLSCCVQCRAQDKVMLADPFILLHEGTYYAYGTHSERGIEVYTSDDLVSWRPHARLALDKNDTWGERWFWAPEVHYRAGRFYMYYSADKHICAAVSDSPMGPFVQPEHKPLIESEETLDASVFVDVDGTAYIVFARLRGEMSVWMAEMTANMMGIKSETMRQCLAVSEPWEKIWPDVIQGPFIYKYDGVYYMLYCANSHESKQCGVGYATAPNIWGPWTKSRSNPVLQAPGGLIGTGHSSLFADKQGELRIAFHSHYNKGSIDPRTMHISRVKFRKSNGGSELSVDRSFITPALK